MVMHHSGCHQVLAVSPKWCTTASSPIYTRLLVLKSVLFIFFLNFLIHHICVLLSCLQLPSAACSFHFSWHVLVPRAIFFGLLFESVPLLESSYIYLVVLVYFVVIISLWLVSDYYQYNAIEALVKWVMHHRSWNEWCIMGLGMRVAREASNSLPSKEVMNHQHWKNEWCITVVNIKACELV